MFEWIVVLRYLSAPFTALVFLVFAHQGRAAEVVVAFSPNLTPYVMTGNKSGILVDRVRAALQEAGHTMKPVFIEALDAKVQFDAGHLDAMSLVPKQSELSGFLSSSVLGLHYQAISLKKSRLSLERLDDIKGLRLASSETLPFYLGTPFEKIVDELEWLFYSEDHRQHLRMLFSAQVDVVISDKNMIKFFLKKSRYSDIANLLYRQSVVYHDIMDAENFYMMFRDRDLRDDFDTGIANIKDNGLFNKIEEKYLNALERYR